MTLDKLEIFTCDEVGKKMFINRSIEENKNKPVLKRLILSNFGFYWNS